MDALLSPVIVCVVGPLVTWALMRALQRAQQTERRGSTKSIGPSALLPALLLEACLVALAYFAVLHVIGPELVTRQAGLAAQLGALGGAALTLIAALLALRQSSTASAPSAARHLLAGGLLLAAAALVVALGPWSKRWVVGCALALTLLGLSATMWRRSAKRSQSSESSAVGIVLACTLALAAWAGAATLLTVSAIPNEDVSECSSGRARFRMRVSPWDGNARLALAWDARRTRHLDRAESHGEQAVRLGADAAATLDFFAELAAARGECAESYARFETALRIRAAEAFTGVLERPLQLGESALPPTYVRDCLRSPSESTLDESTLDESTPNESTLDESTPE